MAASDQADMELFEAWMKQYNKEYKDEALKEIRFRSFKINLRDIEAIQGHWMGLKLFSDMTVDEFIRDVIGRTPGDPGYHESDSDEDEVVHQRTPVKPIEEAEHERR